MLPWDTLYMQICHTMAQRSKDSTKVGACIVDSNRTLLAAGFNGPPRCVADAGVPTERPEKYDWVIHAEHNAILFALAARGEYMLKDCALYTNATICSKCILVAAQVGIKRIVCGPVQPKVCTIADVALMASIAQQSDIDVSYWREQC